jgi:hypothetical protein
MAINVNEQDATIEKMLAPQLQRLSNLGLAINGAGPEVADAYRSLSSTASAMVDVGKSAAGKITGLRADQSVPRDFRLQQENETRDAARIALTKFNEAATTGADQLERSLISAMLPAPSRDSGTRLLVRDTIRTRHGHLDGPGRINAASRDLGKNLEIDAELLSADFGAAFLGDEEAASLRERAVVHYMGRLDGTRQQIAARKGLSTFRSENIRGALSGFREAGKMHLSKVD